jgi:lactate dehydrogenase-like 2-hydroxyacid dehydrogenase
VYLDADRVSTAVNLKLVITAGIGSDHTDPETARQHGITVAEVTGSNSSAWPCRWPTAARRCSARSG